MNWDERLEWRGWNDGMMRKPYLCFDFLRMNSVVLLSQLQ